MDATKKAEILGRLKALGIFELAAEYSGSGDSGQFDCFTAYGKDHSYLATFDLDMPFGEAEALKKVTARLTDTKYETFSGELEALIWEAVDEAGHNGFWNNEGGDGKLVFNVVDNTIRLEHRNRIESFEESSHELCPDDPNGLDTAGGGS